MTNDELFKSTAEEFAQAKAEYDRASSEETFAINRKNDCHRKMDALKKMLADFVGPNVDTRIAAVSDGRAVLVRHISNGTIVSMEKLD